MRNFITGVLTLVALHASAWGQDTGAFVGVKHWDGWGSGRLLTTDPAGNVILVGWSPGGVDFGGGVRGSAESKEGYFIVKYSPVGTHVWSLYIPVKNSLDLSIDNVVSDGNGNFVILGRVNSGYPNPLPIDLGGQTVAGPDGRVNSYVARFSAAGQLQWVKNPQSDVPGVGVEINDIATDSEGNVFIVGTTGGTTNFGGENIPSGKFLAKFSPTGKQLWAQGFGGGGRLVIDRQGNVIIAGYFKGTVNLGGWDLTAGNGWDWFLASYSGATGGYLWSKALGTGQSHLIGAGELNLIGLKVDPNGNIGICSNLDVAKYSPTGDRLWTRGFSIKASDWATNHSFAIDSQGNIVLVGDFEGTADFGKGPLTTAGGTGIAAFVVKYGPGGDPIWTKMFGSSATANGQYVSGWGVAVDSSRNVYVTGDFYGEINFGGGVVVSSLFWWPGLGGTPHDNSEHDAFLLRLAP